MKIIFLLISIMITIVIIYCTGRTMFTHEEILREYKSSDDLILKLTIMGIIHTAIIFTSLCNLNNTFWHLPYN